MAPATGTAILVLSAFVLPGFVALLIRERTYIIRGEDSTFERLLNALSLSAIVYAIATGSALIAGVDTHDISDLYHGRSELWQYALLGAGGLFVLPALVAEVGRRWNGSRRLRPSLLGRLGVAETHATPAGWEHFFLRGHAAMVRATLSDGRVVGGYFGEDSFAGYTAQTRDLFLEQRWVLDDDDWFDRPAENSLGLWIDRDAIRSIEFYEPPPGT
jgi:Family of unknown function (DUF6338)